MTKHWGFLGLSNAPYSFWHVACPSKMMTWGTLSSQSDSFWTKQVLTRKGEAQPKVINHQEEVSQNKIIFDIPQNKTVMLSLPAPKTIQLFRPWSLGPEVISVELIHLHSRVVPLPQRRVVDSPFICREPPANADTEIFHHRQAKKGKEVPLAFLCPSNVSRYSINFKRAAPQQCCKLSAESPDRHAFQPGKSHDHLPKWTTMFSLSIPLFTCFHIYVLYVFRNNITKYSKVPSQKRNRNSTS